MDLETLGNLGWRIGLIAVIALLVLYIVVIFMRMRRLQQQLRVAAAQAAAQAAAPVAVPAAAVAALTAFNAVAAAAAAETAAAPLVQLPAGDPAPVPESALDSGAQFAWNEAPQVVAEEEQLAVLQRDVYELRCEVDELREQLRAEVLAVREDFRRQLVQSPGSAPGSSPLYNDAMQMAAQGQDATAIAKQCGIARAEADLVVALARNRNDGIGQTSGGS